MKTTLTVACFFLKSAWQAACRPFSDQFRRRSTLRSGSLRSALTALLLAPLALVHADDNPIPIWPQGAPGALGKTEAHSPTLTPYLPANPSGAAILIIPGGSYGGIYPGQTEPFALWLNEQGITAFVLRYRLGSKGYRYPSQLQDAVEAMRQIREQAAKWKIDPNRIGAMGFSAGGHLLTTLLNRPEDGELPGMDTTGRASPRPDIAIVCYPVISMITKPHRDSSLHLLGNAPGEELLRKTSSELQVRSGLPPVFLWHTSEDKLVPVDHTLLYASALREHGIPHELHIYQHGGHGTGMIGSNHPWLNDLVSWLRAQKFIYNSGSNVYEYAATDSNNPYDGVANNGAAGFANTCTVGSFTNFSLSRGMYYFALPNGISAADITNATLKINLFRNSTKTGRDFDIYSTVTNSLGLKTSTYGKTEFNDPAFTDTGLGLTTNAATGWSSFNVTALVKAAAAAGNATNVIAFRYQMANDTAIPFGTDDRYIVFGFGNTDGRNPKLVLETKSATISLIAITAGH